MLLFLLVAFLGDLSKSQLSLCKTRGCLILPLLQLLSGLLQDLNLPLHLLSSPFGNGEYVILERLAPALSLKGLRLAQGEH